uniref:C2H2-type domain-containing protein n=1 Tax=Neogobius melanostomus TaxID=47308 RepID=A0A8C6UGH6_9GOBI
MAATEQCTKPASEQMLRRVLTDSFCHVCDAVLVHESQRSSHYQVRRLHGVKPSYNNNTRSNSASTQFCSLCNMVFSSAIVAKSHYNGKVHRKNSRKRGHTPNCEYNSSTTVIPVKVLGT